MAAYYLFTWDLDRAEAESRRTVELDPNYSQGHHIRSYIFLAMNRDEEGLREQKRATEIDPFAHPWALGNAYLMLRQYDAAINELTAGAAVRHEFWTEYELSDAYHFRGADKEAAQHIGGVKASDQTPRCRTAG